MEAVVKVSRTTCAAARGPRRRPRAGRPMSRGYCRRVRDAGRPSAMASKGSVRGSRTSYSTSISAAAALAWARECRRPPRRGRRRRSGSSPHRHQLPPVVADEPLVALPGHVGGRDHRQDAGRRRGGPGIDAPDERTRVVGKAQGAVQHPRDDMVGDVLLQSQHLLTRRGTWAPDRRSLRRVPPPGGARRRVPRPPARWHR